MKDKPRFTVLFADRNPGWKRGLKGRLRRQGIRVVEVSGAREMLERLAEGPDVLVLDEGLEEMGADVLLRLIRESTPHLPIVLIRSEDAGDAPNPDGLRRFARSIPDEQLRDLLRGSRRPHRRPRPPVILCVDDEEFYLESLARILRRHGYSVVTFQSPERAQEAIPVVRPDLLFIDILMPGMSGLDLAQEIRDGHGDAIPIVFLSAKTSDDEILDGYRHGASYYIPKPCNPQAILNIADYILADLDPGERELLEAQL